MAQQIRDVEPDSIDAIFSDYDEPGRPGCALGVVDNGEFIYRNGYGSANLEHDIPITTESRFMIASISKQFAAAAMVLLDHQGELSLDDDIREHLPIELAVDEPITIRHLIHHTSGIRDIYNLIFLADYTLDHYIPDRRALEMIARQEELNFEPGEEYLYSNAAYFLLSVITEQASGKTLRQYTSEHLFEPLGMHDTHFNDNRRDIVENRAMSYRSANQDSFAIQYRLNMERVGARGLFTSVDDFLYWDRNFNDNRLDMEAFNEVMLTVGTPEDSDNDYAFGIRVDQYKQLETIGHSGSYMGFRTNYMRFPEMAFSIITFCNQGSINPAGYNREVADRYLAGYFEEVLAPYAGSYRNEAMDVTYNIELDEGDLYLNPDGSPSGKLSHSEGDEFSLRGWDIVFMRNDGDEVTALEVDTGRARGVRFERVEDP